MFKYTLNTLKKIVEVFKASGYIVRFEKGNFKAGYCILENKNVVVINKYYSVEAKINCLLDILPNIDIIEENLHSSQLAFFEKTLVKQ